MKTKFILKNCNECGVHLVTQGEKICSDCWLENRQAQSERLDKFTSRLLDYSENDMVGDEAVQMDIYMAVAIISVLSASQDLDFVDEILGQEDSTTGYRG